MFWLLVAVVLGLLAPSLDAVADKHSVSLAPQKSPAYSGHDEHRSRCSRSSTPTARRWWSWRADNRSATARTSTTTSWSRSSEADTKHVEHVQDFWGDPLTAAGSQSSDGKAAYVQVFLSGNQGEALSQESVDALRNIVAKTPAPPGVKAYVAGSAPQIADQFEVGRPKHR